MIVFARREAFRRPSNRPWRRYPRRCRPAQDATLADAFARAGFHGQSKASAFDGVIAQSAFWLEAEPVTDGKRALRERLARAYAVAEQMAGRFSEDQRRAADYLLVTKYGFPAYHGRRLLLRSAGRLSDAGLRNILHSRLAQLN